MTNDAYLVRPVRVQIPAIFRKYYKTAGIAPLEQIFRNRKGLHSQLLAGSPLDRELRSRLPDGADLDVGGSAKAGGGLCGDAREDNRTIPEGRITTAGLLHLVAVRVPFGFGLATLHQSDDFLFVHGVSPFLVWECAVFEPF